MSTHSGEKKIGAPLAGRAEAWERLRRFQDGESIYALGASRAQWRSMSLRYLLVPVLGAPVLVFDEKRQARAAVLQALMLEQGQRYRRTADPSKRIAIAQRIRRYHSLRVTLAVRYRYPASCAEFEFAADGHEPT